jgi:hypothetical protein
MTAIDADPPAPARYYGKYPGVVVDRAAPPGEAHRGELRVRVPGILEDRPDGGGHRPLEVVAAPCYPPGFFFVPAVDAPVWVEFVAGELEAPIWTGVWYARGAAPPTATDAAPSERHQLIRTAAGHVIELDDAGAITIRHGQGRRTITLTATAITISDQTGADQAVVLAPFLDWLLTHTHVGPTGPVSPVSKAVFDAQLAQMRSGS